MKKIFILLLATALFAPKIAQADEGMWLPMFVNKLNYADMKKQGLKLTADQIYNVNKSSMKDAIVRLGTGFCTGEMISSQGLMLTNHHCGYGEIQKNSSPENDYLKDGFWAMTKEQEIPTGFSVSFLDRMEDVTAKVLDGVTESMSVEERAKLIRANSKAIQIELKGDSDLSIEIKSFFKGNNYYALIYEIYNDVRWVGAPPSSVGKYGGDTDNWMWPRHTGDFCLFRVYANKDNKPAKYSKDNVPYEPKHHLPVSLKGVEQGDYAMIFGYPGSTDRYLTSYGVNLSTTKELPERVKVRRMKLDVYEKYMQADRAVGIQYASKHARVSNYWKNFMGMTKALKKLNIEEQKKKKEDEFMAWVKANDKTSEYGEVMNLYKSSYEVFRDAKVARNHLIESMIGTEIFQYGFGFARLQGAYEALNNKDLEDAKKANIQAAIDATVQSLNQSAPGHFKNYYRPIDMDICEAMLKMYMEDVPADLRFPEINTLNKKFKGNYSKMAATIFKKTMLDEESAVMSFLEKPSYKALKKDMGVYLSGAIINHYRTGFGDKMKQAEIDKAKADRLFMKGRKEMNPKGKYYPDANSTMRVTYGNVLDYSPADAVKYKHFTTMDGVLEKYIKGDHEFDLPLGLITLAQNKDYGQYAAKDGSLRVCFLSNNDITGGNSGSPVINGNGELIGTAFDGNWEAMSGDVAFEPRLQRTISVDIRYTLFIIDKYAGARHLIDEMTIVK